MPPSKPSREQLERYAHAFNQSLTLKHWGMEVHFPDPETVLVALDELRPAHRGGLGSDAVNGGVLSAAFDLAIGCSVALIDPSRRSATVQLSINLMKPVRGDRFTVRAKVDRGGETLVFASATLFDDDEQPCANATLVCRISSIPWASEGTPAIN